jgi:RNA polymerase sigma factor (sigma-70 family)
VRIKKLTKTFHPLAEAARGKHAATIRRRARWLWPHLDDLDDVVQEVNLRLLGMDPNRRVEKEEEYLYTVVRHVVFDWARRERWRKHVAVDTDAVEAWANDPDNAVPDDMAERLSRKQQYEAARQALPPRWAEALQLHCEDMPNDKIAEHMGLDVESVGSYINRAKAQMRQLQDLKDQS